MSANPFLGRSSRYTQLFGRICLLISNALRVALDETTELLTRFGAVRMAGFRPISDNPYDGMINFLQDL